MLDPREGRQSTHSEHVLVRGNPSCSHGFAPAKVDREAVACPQGNDSCWRARTHVQAPARIKKLTSYCRQSHECCCSARGPSLSNASLPEASCDITTVQSSPLS